LNGLPGRDITHKTEYLTAETERGRQAIEEVMQHSYADAIDRVPAHWTRARLIDGAPVSFIQVDPDRRMDLPGGEMRYAFILNVATREDRRREGHFRDIMEHAFSSLRAAGIPLVCTHGRYSLYRRFGFGVFTHHCGIFASPELIEKRLGAPVSEEGRSLLIIDEHKALKEDLLLISDVRARTLSECRTALQAAAAVARERGKTRILFEHPAAPSYGSRYPIYASPETPLTALARACGAEVRLRGADPERDSIPDADWIKVLDADALVRGALNGLQPSPPLPQATVCFLTDAGVAVIESLSGRLTVSGQPKAGANIVQWPSSALAQLVTGYQSARVLAAIQGTAFGPEALALLTMLFPQCWRFSRNESWVFTG
jgi:GNAT superfamily N-acetyltransferase